jgi:hypothetical protein
MDRCRRADRQPFATQENFVKRLVSLSAAMLFMAACSEATAPTSDLSTRQTKPTSGGGGISVAGNLTNDTYTFENFSISGAGGTSWAADQLTDGTFGTSSPAITDAYNHSTHFMGRVDNTALFLIVPNPGSRYALTFDLYIIGSWDGQGQQAQNGVYGHDIWRASIRCGSPTAAPSQVLLETDFSNQLTVQQSYPNWATTKGGSKAGTGSYGQDLLGSRNDPSVNTPTFRSFGDTEYHMSFSGANPCAAGQTAYFTFVVPNANLQSNYDESWGLDNVSIKTDA